jgi:hypothetical protein
MNEGYVRTARREDIPVLAENLREADVAEIKASSGKAPGDALYASLDLGGDTRVICLHDGTPVGIFGVVPITKDLGGIWMVATNQFKSVQRQFLRECRTGITDLCQGYKAVFNCTDARNTVHHRWIKWSGFTIIKRHESYGVEQRPFLEFVRISEGHHV